MTDREFNTAMQCGFKQGFEEGQLYILEKIKSEMLSKITEDRYDNEIITDGLIGIVDNHIKELNK